MSHEDEQPILQQIHDLVAEEHQLRSTHTGIGLNSAERNRLDALERELDRCWDLLRHRRAAEEYGDATGRDARDTGRDARNTGRDGDDDAAEDFDI
jgi:hypothetical protein